MLKNRKTDKVLFVVIFTLIPKDQADNAEDQEAAQKEEGQGGKEKDVKVAEESEDLD